MGGLFCSIVVGGVEVPDRIVMPPMTTRLANDEGHITDALLAHFRSRALGGVGLITPLYGLALLLATTFAEVPFSRGLVKSVPIYVVFFVIIPLLIFFPVLSLLLPGLMGVH